MSVAREEETVVGIEFVLFQGYQSLDLPFYLHFLGLLYLQVGR